MIRRRLTAVVALVATACTGWRVKSDPTPETAQGAAMSGEGHVRLRLRDGREVFLRAPAVQADSIVGYSRDERSDYARHAYAIKDVREIATFGPHAGKTALAVGVGVAAVASLVALCVQALSDI